MTHTDSGRHSRATSTHAAHIVVVEDDPGVAATLTDALQIEGYRVSTVTSGRELKSLLATQTADLITLDLGLPDEDGIELARHIYATHTMPIIMVTGKAGKFSRIAGLEIGADDYIVKPFDMDELVARVRAVLRRSRRTAAAISGTSSASSAGSARTGHFTFDGWRYDIAGRRLQTPRNEFVDLTSSEQDLLAIFLRHPRAVHSRARIASELRGADEDGTAERSVDVLVGRLRRKLERYEEGRELIKTVRGEGYILSPEVTES